MIVLTNSDITFATLHGYKKLKRTRMFTDYESTYFKKENIQINMRSSFYEKEEGTFESMMTPKQYNTLKDAILDQNQINQDIPHEREATK